MLKAKATQKKTTCAPSRSSVFSPRREHYKHRTCGVGSQAGSAFDALPDGFSVPALYRLGAQDDLKERILEAER